MAQAGFQSAIVLPRVEPIPKPPAIVAGMEIDAMIPRFLSLVLLVVPGYCWGRALDKTGTSGAAAGAVSSQTLEKKKPAKAGSFLTERAGFEPAVGFYPHAALAKRCFRPLSHLSRCLKILA